MAESDPVQGNRYIAGKRGSKVNAIQAEQGRDKAGPPGHGAALKQVNVRTT